MSNKVSFEVEIIGNDGGIKKTTVSLNNFDDLLDKIGNKVKKIPNDLGKWATTVTALNQLNQVISGINDQIQKIAGSFNSFEQSMRAVNTMAGYSEEEFKGMKDSISELGKVIPKTREELADGLYQVISNGVPEDNWLSFLEASAKASVGGIADLGQTVTVTSTIIKNYGLSWEKAADIQDKIQMTAKNGVTSFEQLAAALPRVTGSAATLGVSIDELMATFATLTGVSGNTAEVSTQLSAIFTALIKPSSEAAKMAEEMGIKFDASVIQAAGGMDQFLTQLDECVKEYSATSGVLETEVYGRLFGSAEAVRALIPLTGELSEKYSSNVEAMSDSTGTIDEAFSQMSSTGQSVSIMFHNSIAAMTDWIGSVASSAAPMANFITGVGQTVISLTAIGTAIGTVVPYIKNMGSAIGELAVKIGTATAAWIKNTASMVANKVQLMAHVVAQKAVQAATAAWTAVQKVLNGVLTMNPIGMIITAIGLLVTAIITAYNNCDEFRAICDRVFEVIKNVASIIWDALVKAFDAVTGAIKKAWNWIKKFLGIGKEDTEEQADALNDEADAANNAADAYSNLANKKDKATGSIRVSGGAKTPAKSNGKPGKAAAPAGSIAAIDAAIQEKQAIYKTAVDAASRAKVQKELDDLEAQKRLIEFEVQCKMNGFDSIRDALDFGEKLKPVDIGVNGLPALKAANAGLVDVRKNEQKLDSTTKALNRDGSKFNDTMGASGELFGSMSRLTKALTKDEQNQAAAYLEWGAAVVQSVGQAVTAIMALIPVKQAEQQQSQKNTTANVAEAASGLFSGFAEIPIVGIILALAAVAGMVATMLSLPKFAKGGIAFGPTVGMFGEYPGAANNPEVVAPLSRLKSLLGDSGNGGGEVEFRIKGRRLVGVLAKEGNVMARR